MLGDEEARECFAVWEENWPTLKLFLRMRRQWRYGAMGGVIGLDWPGIESRLRLMKTEMTAEMLDDLDAMEDAALEALNAA